VPRYLVERAIPAGLDLLSSNGSGRAIEQVLACYSDRRVHWIHSFVSVDQTRMFCLCNAPGPEAIRLSSRAGGLPVERIFEISVLDPFSTRMIDPK